MDKKKSLKLKVATVVMMSSTALALCLTAGCGHAFTDDWTSDATNHWHACVEPGCTEKLNEAAHVDENEDGKCDVCNYVLKVNTENPGGETHEHAYNGEWQTNAEKHWKECTADGCTTPAEKSQEGSHVYTDDSDTTCNTCGYTRTVDPDTPPVTEVTVSLDKTTLTLNAEQTATLTATVTGSEDPVEWTVTPNDDSIVTISANGKTCTVTAVAGGTAKVKVTLGEKSAECTVTVNATGGGEEELPQITGWGTVGDPIYGEVHENDNDYIYHHIFLNDADVKEYDFDSYEATVTLDGVAGEIVAQQALNDNDVQNHTYHLHIRIIGNKYQTAVFTINFKKDGKVVAVGTYTRVGNKEVKLDTIVTSISIGESETISITTINGSEDLTGKTISWSISDTEGTGVASIPDNSNGNSVVVTALAEGKATLTCTIGTGSDAFSATCTITVVEGEVVIVSEDITDSIKFNDKFQADGDAIQLRLELTAELKAQINENDSPLTVKMDGNDSNFTLLRVYWQDGSNNLWFQIKVASDWSHDYEFIFSLKNAKGIEVAHGIYQEIAPAELHLDKSSLNLELVAGETVTGIITATKTSKVEGDVEWSIDDESVATILDNGDGTVTVTAVAKGTATVTATVGDLTQTCEVNVLEEGEEAPVITITDYDKFEGPYGDGRFYKFRFNGTDENVGSYANIKEKFDHTDVDGVTTDHKEFYIGGGVDCYIVTVHFATEVVSGTTYKIDLCDEGGNILATFSWTAD